MTPNQAGAKWAQLTERVAAHLRAPLFRNGYALLFSGAATSALGLVYWAVAARLYPAEIVGLNSALLAAMSFLSAMAQLSLSNVLVRYLPNAGGRAARFVWVSYALCLAASVVVGVVFLAGLDFWSPALRFLAADRPWLALFLVGLATWGIFTLQDSALTGLRETVWVPIENTAFAVLKLVLVVALAGWLPRAGIFLSWTVPVTISLIPVNLIIFGYAIPRQVASAARAAPSPALREMARYAGGNYVGLLLLTAYTSVLPIVVANVAGVQATAYFYLPWTIATGLQLITTNLVTSLTVEATTFQTHLRSYSLRILRQALRLLVPVVAVIVIGAPWFMGILGPDYAREGTTLLRLLALAALPNALVVLAVGVVRVQNRPQWIVATHAALGAIVLTLTYGLLPRLGVGGVGLAWLVGQTLLAAVLGVIVLRPLLRQPETVSA